MEDLGSFDIFQDDTGHVSPTDGITENPLQDNMGRVNPVSSVDDGLYTEGMWEELRIQL